MIDFNEVSISFGAQPVLDEVSFRIGSGERVGIVGPNGAGKSTLFSLLAGELQPDSGKIFIPHDLMIGYLRQQLRPHIVDCTLLEYAESAQSIIQEIHREIESIEAALPCATGPDRDRMMERLGTLQTEFEHRGGYELSTLAKTALCGLGFSVEDLQRPFRSFSGGWQMRAELARALAARPNIFLLDEPTNFLDIPAVEWLQRFLREYPGTLLMISHDRYLLNSLSTTTLEVFGGQVTRYPGNYDNYLKQRAARYEQLVAAKKNQDRQKAQVEQFIERFRAKNTKATQVQSRIKMLEKMDDIVVPVIASRAARIRLPEPPHCGQEVARMEDAGISYNGEIWVLRHVNLQINQGEKTALVGMNGLGKSTLLRGLAGKVALREGKYVKGHKVVIGYQAQDFAETMDPSLSVYAAAKSAVPTMTETCIRSILGGFLFPGDAVEKPIRVLSGGEKMRLALACMLLRAPNFLLLDEPTTHLDIPSREALEQALISYTGTLLLVSHDIEFVRRVATQIIAMVPQNIQRYVGNYDYYREKLATEQAGNAGATQASATSPPAGDRKVLRQERAAQRLELSRVSRELKKKVAAQEKQIEHLEHEQKTLVDALQSPASAEAGLDFETVGKRLKQIQHELEACTLQWEHDSQELEAALKPIC